MSKHISRRAFVRHAALGAGTLVLAACGGTPASAPADSAANSAPAVADTSATAVPAAAAATSAPAASSGGGSMVEISYWGSFSGDLGKAEQAMVDAFNSSQQDVMVNYEFQGSYEETAQKVTAALQANNAPDVSLLSDVWWFKFYTAQQLAPMNDLLKAENVDTSDYVDVLLKEGTRKDQVYWVPFARSTPLFYYNKDAWAEAGLPDRGPETWDEMVEWAPKLLKKDGDQVSQAAFAHPGAASYVAWLFQGVIWQFEGSYSKPDFTITLTEPNGVKAGQFYQQTIKDGWATTPQDVQQDFVTGLTASAMMSTGSLSSTEATAQFKVGTAFLPKQVDFGCPTGGAGMAILKNAPAEKQQAAAKWIAFATSKDSTITWSQSTGYMPVRTSAATDPKMIDFFKENPNFQVAVEQLPKTRPQDAARVFIPGGDQILGKGMERILINSEPVDTVFTDVAQELQQNAQPMLEMLKTIEG